ncbi:MAG: hypothetical protein RUMPE_01277 [Eubacteriales bacterium SKADARSKE-1]|nr:hypothetical protein [Eubacteriales bacterium SKADARSKE-1]
MVNDRVYLEPPDNEDAAVYKCEHCGNFIFEGDEYFEITGETLCEHCLHFLYSKFAQAPEEPEEY